MKITLNGQSGFEIQKVSPIKLLSIYEVSQSQIVACDGKASALLFNFEPQLQNT